MVVHSPSIQDRDGAKLVINRLKGKFSRLKLIWADGGYAGRLIDWTWRTSRRVIEIVKRNKESEGFVVQAKRWIVERTFAWLGRYRRLSKDYETLPDSSEALIQLAMIHVMVRRLSPSRV